VCGDLLGQDHVVDTDYDEMASNYEQHAPQMALTTRITTAQQC